MLEYDFLILSPNEFENLSRDLLQKKLGVYIESFTTGRDGGIDFRHTIDKSKKYLIQSKRYKDFSSLYTNLKKEAKKVGKLKSDKYFLTTSVGLTPKNKSDILTLFSPHIKKTEDILGKDDLNNLLGQYSDVEKKYYKLWLSSINILEKILHSKIYNQSSFELEEIKEQVKLYVQNNSFNESLSILNKNRYVIISGIPGIGKTTLARILILYLLSSNFDEFVYLTDSIDEGYEYFNDEKKQVFFFDDFLGKIRFDAKNELNVDDKIVKFIDKIKKSPNKILIFATREYILSQARNTFEAFNLNNIEIAKCILDLSSYTRIIKAQIIYNHLFFANIPEDYLMNLVNNENYLKLVNHKNYNPRIIETVINRKIWNHCSPSDFTKHFKSYFDNPESVWQYAFENSLDKFSQYVLLVLLSTGTPILISDLELAVKEFLLKNNYKYLIHFDSITFNRAIRELENTFIKTQKDSYDAIVIDFQNPSIQDFLINYLKGKEDLITSLIESMIFSNQFFNIFTTDRLANNKLSRFIKLSKKQVQISIERIKLIYNKIHTSKVIKLNQDKSEKFYWYKYSSYIYSFLFQIYSEFSAENEDARNFVYEKFQELILINEISYTEQDYYVKLLSELDLSILSFNEEQLINKFISNLNWIDNIEVFSRLNKIFPTTYMESINDESFIEKVTDVIQEEVSNTEDSDTYDIIEKIENIESKFSIDYQEEIQELKQKGEDYDEYIESQIDSYIEDRRDFNEPENLSHIEETEMINQIFNSLINE